MSAPVLIVGAGVAGLSLSLLLSERNVRCHVLEGRCNFDGATSGVRISADGTQILQEMNIESIGERSTQIRMRFQNMFSMDFNCKHTTGTPSAMIVTRLALFEKLIERAKSYGVQITMGFKVESVIESAEGVEVASDTGAQVKGSLLVGADGVGSLIRKLLNPGVGSSKKYAGYVGVGFITEHTAQHEFTMFRYPGHQVGVATCGKVSAKSLHNSVFMWTHIHMPEDQAKQATQDLVLVELDRRYSGWNPELQRLYDVYKGNPTRSILVHGPVYNGRPPAKWYSERMILIGDAAHPFGPGGQGISMALKDAKLLCQVIVNGFREEDKRLFQQRREQEAREFGEASEERNKLENQAQTRWWLFFQGLLLKIYWLVSWGTIKM